MCLWHHVSLLRLHANLPKGPWFLLINFSLVMLVYIDKHWIYIYFQYTESNKLIGFCCRTNDFIINWYIIYQEFIYFVNRTNIQAISLQIQCTDLVVINTYCWIIKAMQSLVLLLGDTFWSCLHCSFICFMLSFIVHWMVLLPNKQ